jgi:Rod binding domain-containing protein
MDNYMDLARPDYLRDFRVNSGNVSGSDKHISVDKKSDYELKKEKLRKAAEGFEAIFISHLFKTMRESMTENSMFGKGSTGEIYGDILDNSIAEKMAEKSEFGLADALFKEMIKKLDMESKADTIKNVVPTGKTLVENED